MNISKKVKGNIGEPLKPTIEEDAWDPDTLPKERDDLNGGGEKQGRYAMNLP